MPNDSESRWSSDSETLHTLLTQAGYDVNIQFAGNDASAQVQQIQDMIGAGCTTILVTAVDPSTLAQDLGLEDPNRQRISGGSAEDEVLDEAHAPAEDAINLIAYQKLLTDSNIVDYYIGFDGYEAGYLQASYIEESLSLYDTSETYCLELFFGDINDPITAFQYQGAMEVLQVYIDSGVLTIASGQTSLEDTTSNDSSEAKRRLETMLSNVYADQDLDAILCSDDTLALALSDTLFEHYTGGIYPVLTGQGCLEASVNNLTSNRQSMTLLDDCTGMAAEAARIIMALASGSPTETEDSLDNGRINVPASLFYPAAVRKDNIQDLLVTPGYFTANSDGTYSAATDYTAGGSQNTYTDDTASTDASSESKSNS